MHEYEKINAPGGQDTLLTGPSRIQKGRYKSRKGWPWSGALVETKITPFVPVILSPSFIRRPQATVILDFEPDGGMKTKILYEDVFCHTVGRLFDASS